MTIEDLLATTFAFLPRHVDFASFVLQGAGFFGLIGSFVSLLVDGYGKPWRISRLPIAELSTIAGAIGAALVFLVLWGRQELG